MGVQPRNVLEYCNSFDTKSTEVYITLLQEGYALGQTRHNFSSTEYSFELKKRPKGLT